MRRKGRALRRSTSARRRETRSKKKKKKRTSLGEKKERRTIVIVSTIVVNLSQHRTKMNGEMQQEKQKQIREKTYGDNVDAITANRACGFTYS
jgi:hypothetical protein